MRSTNQLMEREGESIPIGEIDVRNRLEHGGLRDIQDVVSRIVLNCPPQRFVDNAVDSPGNRPISRA